MCESKLNKGDVFTFRYGERNVNGYGMVVEDGQFLLLKNLAGKPEHEIVDSKPGEARKIDFSLIPLQVGTMFELYLVGVQRSQSAAKKRKSTQAAA